MTHDTPHDTTPESDETPLSFVVTITKAQELTGLSIRTIQRRLDAGTLEAVEMAGKRWVRLRQSDLSPGTPHDAIAAARLESDAIEGGLSHDVSRGVPHGLVNDTQPNSLALALDVSGDGAAIIALLSHVARESAQEAVTAVNVAQRGPSASDLAAQVFVTVSEAATLAGVGKSAIERAVKAGALKTYSGLGRGRRVKAEEVLRWAKAL